MKNKYFGVTNGSTTMMLHWRRTLQQLVILLSNANYKLLHLFAKLITSNFRKQFKSAGSTAPFRGLRILCLCVFVALFGSTVRAQLNTDNAYAKPLKEVLNDIQKKYGVTIRYADSMVANKKVNYAEWKYRPDVEVTLENILTPFELKVKKDGDTKYKLDGYEY